MSEHDETMSSLFAELGRVQERLTHLAVALGEMRGDLKQQDKRIASLERVRDGLLVHSLPKKLRRKIASQSNQAEPADPPK